MGPNHNHLSERKPSVIIVEDEVLIAEEIRQALEDEEFLVWGTPATAAEAIESCSQHRPDIAVVDIRLKGNIDGIDTASTLRTQFNIPIVFLTAHAAQSDLERAKKVEPVGFVMKPVVIPELIAGLKLGLVKHEAERKLLASERRLATILRCLSDAVIVVDKSGLLEFMNEASERMLMIRSESALGRPPASLFSVLHSQERYSLMPDIMESFQQPSEKAGGGHPPLEGLLIQDGDERPVEIQCAPMHDETGALVGGILVIRDISEQLRANALRLQLEERLFQVQKMEALGQLAGGIAHDFNNLLTAIIGNLAILRQGAPPTQQKLFGATEKVCSRAAQLVRELLSFGRNETEALIPTEMTPIVNEVLDVLRASSPHDISIDTNLSSPLPAVSAGSSQLYQIVMNLCINARDAVLEAKTEGIRQPDRQRPDIFISLTRKPTPHHLRATIHGDVAEIVELVVADAGTGMSEETQRRIFEPFFTTKPLGKGTGLGLATVYGIVRKLGGAIEVDTQLGSGTTFRVLLPAFTDPSKLPAPVSVMSSVFRGSGGILIAESDPLVRNIIGAMFDELGYQTFNASSEPEVLSLLDKQGDTIRAILCNADLADTTGSALLAAVHARTPHTPIILITSHGTPSLDTEALPQVSVLQKPYKLQDLAREVTSIIANRWEG